MPGLPARVSIRAMVDETQAEGGSAASICPWCSASHTGSPENCPSCGATLSGDVVPDGSLPGLTAIDAAAIVRATQSIPRPRSRILSWISGEYPDEEGSPAEAGALAPPDPEVRREILRLELEAEVAHLQAEAGALMAEAAAEGHTAGATPEDAQAADAIMHELATVSSELEQTEAAIDSASSEALAAEAETVGDVESATS